MYLDYGHLAVHFQGWPLSEIRAMSVRERRYWCEVAAKRAGLRKVDHG